MTIVGTTSGTIAVLAVAFECTRPPTAIILGPIRPTGPLRAAFGPLGFKNRG
jgi:hypothetical protein